MQISSAIPLTILLSVLLVKVSISLQQSCKSNLYSESESFVPRDGECPIAYVNFNNKCTLFSPLNKEKRTSTCSNDKDCLFSSLYCYQQKCTPKFRIIGETCESDDQCLYQVVANPSIVQMLRLSACINNRCAYYKHEISRKIGEKWEFDRDSKTLYDCKEGVIKYIKIYDETRCVQKAIAKKGERCEDDDPTKSVVCGSGLYCKKNSNSDPICVEKLKFGATCDPEDSYISGSFLNNNYPCVDGLKCRQKSKEDETKTCQRISTYGESCIDRRDCAFANSGMVDCVDNKCQRVYGTPVGGICKTDRECYSAYCSSEGKCAVPVNQKCSNSGSCPSGSSCVCGGKPTSTIEGQCTASCNGAYYDVWSCIYNLDIISFWSVWIGSDTDQYVDENSSLFKKCRFAYSKYYSCLRKSWTAAGIPTFGDMEGIDLNAYSVYDTPLLPRRSQAQSGMYFTSTFMVVIAIMISFLL